MIRNQVFIILYIILSITKIDAQSLLYKIPLEDQINKASMIVEGKVINSEAYFSSLNNHIYTVNKVQVFRVFKGEEQAYINVVTKGGSIGLDREEVKPSLQLRENVLGVFMLEENSNRFTGLNTSLKMYHTYSDLQGFYKYDEYNNLVTNPYYSFSGIKESFYTELVSKTSKNKELVDYNFSFERQSKALESSSVSSITPEIVRSGTGETITITGTNFGSTRGIVQFRDADNGGISFEDAFDSAIQSWSNTSITVRVPSFAGTGKIQIVTNEGDFFQSDNDLTVLSSELNAEFEGLIEEEYRVKLFNSDRQGGYTWTYNETFFENTDAVNAFERAIDEWVCATNISWLISDEQSTIDGTANDGFNIVAFKSPFTDFSEIGFGTLAVTTTYYLGCRNGDTVTSYVDEIDMTFNSDFDWFFGENAEEIGGRENDFQGTATHELGHAHNLGHVIAPTNLMHFQTDRGLESATRLIDDDSRNGAAINYAFSKTPGLCGEIAVEDRECGDDTVVEIIDLVNETFVKSPVDDILVIQVEDIRNLGYSLTLHDISGRLLISETLTNFSDPIDVSFLSSGIYIIKVVAESEVFTKKIIKL